MFVGGKLLGGADATKKLLEEGELQRKIQEARGEALPEELRQLIKDKPSGVEVRFRGVTRNKPGLAWSQVL